jgi:hypothetical protein
LWGFIPQASEIAALQACPRMNDIGGEFNKAREVLKPFHIGDR